MSAGDALLSAALDGRLSPAAPEYAEAKIRAAAWCAVLDAGPQEALDMLRRVVAEIEATRKPRPKGFGPLVWGVRVYLDDRPDCHWLVRDLIVEYSWRRRGRGNSLKSDL